MKKKMKKEKCSCKGHGSCGGCGYFIGFIGAAVYYISSAATVGAGFLGLLKALVWPAFIVFELMKFLAM
tara:strand:- start:931 stop:1137 length:207 start_codon:yes stop_codon:yes gene_type:complete